MNKIMLIGNLTRDPETRTVSGYNGDTQVCSFTIAVNSRRRGQQTPDAQQPAQDDAQFFRINVWGRQADAAQRYLAKGRKVFVSGELTARTYTANDGTTRVSLDVRADDYEFLTSRAEAQAMGGNANYAPAAQPAPTAQNDGFMAVEETDLPF
ncbi:MAG: single-stranded DNA-binding protein [Clostridia bacterium]|nr:single-stranded DNA-binding protein [Clostridia bacterium]MBR4459678.1 single-stranded DNA-binding protein [Clostridia bacterium]